jgi:hypothetical protein
MALTIVPWELLQLNISLTELSIAPQDPPIGSRGEAALAAALQVRCVSCDDRRHDVEMVISVSVGVRIISIAL